MRLGHIFQFYLFKSEGHPLPSQTTRTRFLECPQYKRGSFASLAEKPQSKYKITIVFCSFPPSQTY